jgi:transposase
VFVDESGFYLLPSVLRTWAPVGQTPIIRHKLSREHLSAISGITPDGELYLMVQERSYKGPDVLKFLKQLSEQIGGKLLVIWDGAPIHRSQAVKDYLASGAAARIQLEPLPPYAPELNPDEGVWRYLKRVELRNISCQSLSHLLDEFATAVERLLSKPDVLCACIQEVGYV